MPTTPNVIPGSSKGTGAAQTEVVPEEGLYVPVTNTNFIPEGVAILEGFVPATPQDDRVLNRIKDALETQGLKSGEEAQSENDEVGPPVAPGEEPIDETDETPTDPEAPIDTREDTNAIPPKDNVGGETNAGGQPLRDPVGGQTGDTPPEDDRYAKYGTSS